MLLIRSRTFRRNLMAHVRWNQSPQSTFNLVSMGSLLYATVLLSAATSSKPIDFATEIAPILTKHCLSCHNRSQSKGGLSLSSIADLSRLETNRNIIVPDDPDSSLLIQVVGSGADGKAPEMPAEGSPLTVEQVSLLRAWIKQGASWPEDLLLKPAPRAATSWWSLQPLAPTTPPPVNPHWASKTRNGIDHFILRKLSERKLRPAGEADKQTLIRRLTFDLHGLPPTPQQIDAFLSDSRPDAYERLVDRLLASPRYGERWGRHWLDVIRFGESSGYERNIIRNNAWPFRDYVINSLNRDKPYNRFVQEHLAGDQLAPNNPEVEVGTGFIVGGPYDDVANNDPAAAKQIRANTIDDMITATATAFLGLTINCARCHDHKFDPIPQLDYYRLQSTFAGVRQGSRVLATLTDQSHHAARRQPLETSLSTVKEEISNLNKRVLDRIRPEREELERQFTRPKVDPYGTEERFEPVTTRYVRIEITGTTRGKRSGAVIDEFEVWTPDPDSKNVALASYGTVATASSMRYSNDNPLLYSAAKANDGEYGEFWISNQPGGTFTVQFPQPETISRITWSSDRVRAFTRENSRPFSTDYTISSSMDGNAWQTIATSEGRKPFHETLFNEILLQQSLTADEASDLKRLESRQRTLEQRLAAIPDLPQAWIGRFQQPSEASYLMLGGDPMRVGPEVAPSGLQVLAHLYPGYELVKDAPEAQRRIELARWITDSRNPLFSRVIVNRLWHYHFGRGIVATPSDFGSSGSQPTHPRLLDWLAYRLIDHNWQLKAIHRLIVCSATYRQSGAFDETMASIDSDAHYLWRFPPRRLEAEAIRDAILQVSGSLDLEMGGPGFRLYRYTTDNVATYYPLDEYDSSTFRRTVYHQHVRAAKVDLLSDFDCPDPALPAPQRTTTTSPLQAMSLQNHAFILQQAAAFAERLTRLTPDSPSEQVRLAYRHAFGRTAAWSEIEDSVTLVNAHGLPLFCRAILNANEFIYLQ
ncbi:MAG: hypothetical protein M2R45_04442 [Verrucomicrobia subdivision 3 bacterium]|nr:hypothetical protein [Limisphaerales bacterium]MCS1415026.1 hypothetical protein [Limisphaerales bacterium]